LRIMEKEGKPGLGKSGLFRIMKRGLSKRQH